MSLITRNIFYLMNNKNEGKKPCEIAIRLTSMYFNLHYNVFFNFLIWMIQVFVNTLPLFGHSPYFTKLTVISTNKLQMLTPSFL